MDFPKTSMTMITLLNVSEHAVYLFNGLFSALWVAVVEM